jgi:hypothetical protein
MSSPRSTSIVQKESISPDLPSYACKKYQYRKPNDLRKGTAFQICLHNLAFNNEQGTQSWAREASTFSPAELKAYQVIAERESTSAPELLARKQIKPDETRPVLVVILRGSYGTKSKGCPWEIATEQALS